MLRSARRRLIALECSVPRHISLLQTDLSDLPFREASFQTILCLNALHHYSDLASLASHFRRVLDNGGRIYLTSLVLSNRFIIIGVMIGLAVAIASTHVMFRLLFGVSVTDSTTFVLVSLLLIGVALAATSLPAHRAIKIDPMAALRHE